MKLIQPGKVQPADVQSCRQFFAHFVTDAARSTHLKDAELKEYIVAALISNLGDPYREAAEKGQLFDSDNGLIQTHGIFVDETAPTDRQVQRFNACYLSAEYILLHTGYFSCTRIHVEHGPKPFERVGTGAYARTLEDHLCASRRFYCAAAWLGEKLSGEDGKKAQLCGQIVEKFPRVADTMRVCGLRMRNYANG